MDAIRRQRAIRGRAAQEDSEGIGRAGIRPYQPPANTDANTPKKPTALAMVTPNTIKKNAP